MRLIHYLVKKIKSRIENNTLLISILLIFLAYDLQAQNLELNYSNYTVDNGLPSNEIYHTYQDSKGFIWFATDKGVCKYNGIDFQQFNSIDGLTDDVIFKIAEDDKNRIWFATKNNKLCYFYNDSIIPYRFNDIITSTLKSPFTSTAIITNYLVIDKTTVNLCTTSGILSINNNGDYHYKTYRDDSTKVGLVLINRKKKEPLSTISKAIKYKGEVQNIINIIDNETEVESIYNFFPDKRFDNRHFSIRHSSEDVYLAFFDGLLKYSKNGVEHILKNVNGIHLFEDDKSNIWISTLQTGVYRYNPTSKKIDHFFNGRSITSTLQDHEGNFWFTTLDKGVIFIPSLETKRVKDLSGVRVTSVVNHNRSIYLSYSKGVLDKINNKGIKNTKLPVDINIANTLNVVYPFTNKYLFVGGNKYSFILDNDVNVKSSISRGALCAKHYKSALWVGSYSSLIKINDNDVNQPIFYNRKERIIAIDASNNKDEIYLFMEHRVSKLNIVDIKESIVDSFPDYKITCGFVDNKDLYIGTAGNGLIKVTEFGNFHFNKFNGLNSNTVNCLYQDSLGKIWVGTPSGINVLSKNNDEIIDLINETEGLQSNNINCISGFNNQIYIGTSSGLILLPININRRKQKPKLYLQKVYVNSQPFEKLANLQNDQNNLEFFVNPVSISAKKKIELEYFLEGFDQSWNKTKSFSIKYTSLKPGDYALKIRIFGDNKNSLSINFNILKPFWLEPYFILITICLLLLSAFLYWKYMMKKITRKNEINILIKKYQFQALQAQIDPHFLFNSLNSVHRYISENNKNDALDYLSKVGRFLRNTLELLTIDSLSITEELKLVENYLIIEKQRFKERLNFRIESNISSEMEHLHIPPFLIQPIIENALVHGILPSEERSGFIEVSVNQIENETIEFLILDNGIGYDYIKGSTKQTSKGIRLVEERLDIWSKLNKGTSSLEISRIDKRSKINSGTKVRIVIKPINKA